MTALARRKPVWTLATVVAVAAGGSAIMWRQLAANEAAQPDTQAMRHAESLSTAFRAAAKEVVPSVVTIRTVITPVRREGAIRPRTRVPDQFKGTPFEDFFNDDRFGDTFGDTPFEPREQSSMGSGVIIDRSGVVLTNRHVVDGADKVTVHLSDGRTFEATDIKTDDRTDLAVVRLKGAENLTAARLGHSDRLEVGDWVLAIGNPFGLSETVTAGIISAKGRGLGLSDREDFLQTDAAINPGNSGGPLINLAGEVVGINTAISSRSGGYQGVGFAIPIDIARFVSDQLVKNGTVKRAYLGAAIQPLMPDLAKEFHVDANRGALVSKVMPESPAEKAGLKRGDVVVRFGDQAIVSPSQLVSEVEQTPTGQTRTLEFIRDGKPQRIDVTLREQPKDYGRHTLLTSDKESGKGETKQLDGLGLKVGALTDDTAEQLGLKDVAGVVITRVERGSVAADAGLSPGNVITDVNGTAVKSVDDFDKAITKRPLKDGIRLLVESSVGSRFIVLQVAK
ncbi:MAG: DegQ family serine endoprotease [Pirellulales bacterium]